MSPSSEVPAPAWLIAAVDQRLALMKDKLGDIELPNYPVIMTPLEEPGEGTTLAEFRRWERTCSNCGTYCDDNTAFYTGTVVRSAFGSKVVITYGVCATCKDLP